MFKVYSIVVTYNGEKWAEKCFGSLVSSSIDDHTILCIDNGSSDATLEQIRKKFQNVLIIETGENLGFGKANNIGLKKALDEGADFIFLLNQDAWVRPDAIEKLVRSHLSDQSMGILSPVHLNGSGDSFDYLFKRYLLQDHKELEDISVSSFTSSGTGRVYPVNFINAAMWLIPRKILENVGGFNPYFFLYGEDREYVNRCSYHGFKIGIVSDAIGCHDRIQKESEAIRLTGRLRAFEAEMLDPNKKYSRLRLASKIASRIIKYLLYIRPAEVKNVYSLWPHLLNNENKILRLRKLTSRKGPTFLS